MEQGWTPGDYKLADVIDLLALLVWLGSADASRKPPRNRPKPIKRPTRDDSAATTARIGDNLASLTTVGEFMRLREHRAQLWRERNRKGG